MYMRCGLGGECGIIMRWLGQVERMQNGKFTNNMYGSETEGPSDQGGREHEGKEC